MRRAIPIVIITAALGLAACGGSGSSEAPQREETVEAPSKAAYIAWRDERCKAGKERAAALQHEYKMAAETLEYGRAAEVLHELVERSEEDITETRKRTKPTEDAALLARVEEMGDRGLAVGRKLADVLAEVDVSDTDDLAALAVQSRVIEQLIESLDRLDAQLTRLAERYGFEECGR